MSFLILSILVGGYTIATFDELIKEFIAKYFPPAKIEKIRKDIKEFKQQKDESFKDVWTHFQDLVKKCPRYLIEKKYEL